LVPHIQLDSFVAFVLFCFVLKWQEWHPRLHIPLLCLMVPVIVYWTKFRFSQLLMGITFLAFDLAVWSALHDEMKPFLGKHNFFATSRTQLRLRHDDMRIPVETLTTTCQRLKPAVIGLSGFGDHYDYALQIVVLEAVGYRPQFVQLDAQICQDMARIHARPDLIIQRKVPPPDTIMYDKRRRYQLLAKFESIGLYVPASKAPAVPAAVGMSQSERTNRLSRERK
jgi:hypothetical protein